MKPVYRATRCNDGQWMVHTGGDIIAFGASHDAESKARRVADALNAVITFIPENSHGVKPGYHTRSNVVALLRDHAEEPDAVYFIADMMEPTPKRAEHEGSRAMAYEYIKRNYPVVPKVGERVQHKETGRSGRIMPENKSASHYVQVRFDGDKHSLPCHPTALEYLRTR